jgi:O-antigen ligase
MRAAGWVAVLLVAGGIIGAQGRAVWLAIAAGFMMFVLFSPRKAAVMKVLLPFAVVALVVVAVVPRLRDRMMSAVLPAAGTVSDQQSRHMRFFLWESALGTVQSSPLTGVGLKRLEITMPDPVFGNNRRWTEAHNIFLQIAAEQGVIGLGFFLWILFVLGKIIWSLAPPWRGAAAAVVAAFLVAGLTESWLNDKEIEMIFWMFVGGMERVRLGRERKV